MLGALYGVVDLWYMIGRAWPRVVLRILGWGAAIVAIGLLLEPPYAASFVWGLAAYLVFYLSLFPLFRIYLWAVRRRS